MGRAALHEGARTPRVKGCWRRPEERCFSYNQPRQARLRGDLKMAHEQTPDSSAPQGSGSEPAAASGVSRRHALLRAGSAAAPVLLTLASGPVGATGACTVASSYVSAATFKSRGDRKSVV